MKITYIEHSCFILEFSEDIILIDPFSKNIKNFNFFINSDKNKYILITHGHSDHLDSLYSIYKENIKVVANFEICNFLNSINIKNTVGMNYGGSYNINEQIKISMVNAQHSSSIVYNNQTLYGGNACGYIITTNSNVLYHAGDTSAFLDMKLINELYKPDIGLLPAGGRYTMDLNEVAFVCNNYFDFKYIIPIHYDTFKTIKVDIDRLIDLLNRPNNLYILKCNQSIEI